MPPYTSWGSRLGVHDEEIELNRISDETELKKARSNLVKHPMTLLLIEIILLIISASVGIMCNSISWGDPKAFHGTGWPVPIVCWDDGLDYGSPVGYVVNPLGAMLLMLVFIMTHRFLGWILRKTRTTHGNRSNLIAPLAVLTVLPFLSCGRSPSSSKPDDNPNAQNGHHNQTELTPELAKRVFIEMIRSKGILDDIDGALDALDAAEPKTIRDGYVDFGLWAFNSSKATFAMPIIAPPLFVSYEGDFRYEKDVWTAVITKERRN